MKKLNEGWKIKKKTTANKSFRDSIDFSFSNTTKNEQTIKNNQSNCLSKKVTVNTSPFTYLDISPVVTKDSNLFPLRRSNRLKSKPNTVKPLDEKSKNYQNETSFAFSETFGLQMANEASRFERELSQKSEKVTYANRNNSSVRSKSSPQYQVNNTKTLNTLFIVEHKEKETSKKKEIEIIYSENKNDDNKIKNNDNIHGESFMSNQMCNGSINSESTIYKDKHEYDSRFCNQHSHNSSGNYTRNSLLSKDCYDLAYWGLPIQVVSAYKARNINKMFNWQYECLSMKGVLTGKNLVYSAPTSAGKTLVAEILMLKKVLESKKKAMMILPFVSVVREKVNYFQEMFQDTGIVIDGYMGTHRPPGGFKAVDIAICTIEKANNLVNRLMEEKRLEELGILVVDELHMLGDNSRGYLLELLLTKLLYNCKKYDINIQIIGMSATLPNLNVLSFWLNAELYHTDFRPVPLHEMYKVGPVIYDSETHNPVKDLRKDSISFTNDSDHTIYLTLETVTSGNGVLIFCPSKKWCETLATNIAHEVYKIGRPTQNKHINPRYNLFGQKLREYIDGSLLSDILLQLKNSPAELDSVLKLTIPFGVAFHHAGLTFDERDIIEGAFRQGVLKVLVATSTLSSGVNLPARRVLIRSPMFCGSIIDTLSYKQMVGRAGRKGIDDQGESILLCKESERKSALQLVSSDLKPVKSCLLRSGKNGLHTSLKRAVIEVIASGAATSHEEVIQYSSCTLLFVSLAYENMETEVSDNVEISIIQCLDYLLENDFIFKIKNGNSDSVHISYKPTQLGLAILASGFSPEDALRVLKELQLARRCFVLENDLHILYEVTPPYLSDQMGSLNWMNFLSIWEQLPEDFHRVGELVGVKESFIGLGVQGRINMNSVQSHQKLAIHQRFYAALALNDLIQEVPLGVVSEKYNCNKGILQSLQQTTSTFSGMLTIFCNRLGWHNLELLFSQFQKRVHFGIQQELCDLIQLSTLNAQRARVLYNAGFETVSLLASADPAELELIFYNAGAFESEKQLEGVIAEEALQRREVKRIRITGKQGVNEREAAYLIIKEAQHFIKHELGIKIAMWESSGDKKLSSICNSSKNDETINGLNLASVEAKSSSTLNSNYDNNFKFNVSTLDPIQNLTINSVQDQKSRTAKDDSERNIIDSNVKNNESMSKMGNVERKFNEVVQKNYISNTDKSILKEIEDTKNECFIANCDDCINYKLESHSTYVSKCSQVVSKLPSLCQKVTSNCDFIAGNNKEGYTNFDNTTSLNFPLQTKTSKSCSVLKNDKSFVAEVSKNDCSDTCTEVVLSSTKMPEKFYDKNESYFCSKDVDDLFNELEKTIAEIREKNCSFNGLKNEEYFADNNFTVNQLSLSQSAETENIYFANSFTKDNFQNFSFSELIGNDSVCLKKSFIRSFKVESKDCKFASKKTKDVIDAIIDSPPSLNTNKESDVITKPHSATAWDKYFPNLNEASKKSVGKETELNLIDTNLNTIDKFNSIVVKKDESFDLLSSNTKRNSESTPKLVHLNGANYFDNIDSNDVYSSVLLETSKFDFTELNIVDENVDYSKKNSDSIDQKLLTETSGDIFESEIFGGDVSNKAELNACNFEKMQTSANPDKSKNDISSCSEDIFATDKSFDKACGNVIFEANEIFNLKGTDSEKVSLPSLDSIVIKHNRNVIVQSHISDMKPTKENETYQFSPTVQIVLENSGDLFDDCNELCHNFDKDKNQLSFIFEENSELFKSWDLLQNNALKSEFDQKDVQPQKFIDSPDVNSDNANDDIFVCDISDFSSFSSDILDPTPPEKSNFSALKTVLLETPMSSKSIPININAEDKVKCKLFKDTKNYQIEKNDTILVDNAKMIEKKSLSLPSTLNLNIIDISDTELDSILKLLEKTSIFSLSIACEKIDQKKPVNIGPPNLQEKKGSTSVKKLCIDDDILISGISFCWSEKVFFISFPTGSDDGIYTIQPVDLEKSLKVLQQVFNNFNSKKIVVYDIKSHCKLLWKGCCLDLHFNKKISYMDPTIAAWLLDPSEGKQTVQELVLNYWSDASYLVEGFDRSQGSLGMQHWSSVSGRKRASTEAYVSFHLIKILLNHLNVKKLYKSFVDVEMPSVLSLAKMEQNGLGFDLKLAMNYRKQLQKKQDALLQKAHQLAGRRFNIMSSKDLSRILYKELKLNPPDGNCSPAANRYLPLDMVTRSGSKKLPPELKTNKECLEKIMHLHPLPKTVINWKKLSFAVSKVLMPILREYKFDSQFGMHRLYSTCYIYTVTGRINMHTPNLQFIPRDFNIYSEAFSRYDNEEDYCQIDDEISEYGVTLRNMFIASKGKVLLSADYSQLELRILAHLSGDVKLLKSLNNGGDIFKQIAADWKSIPIDSINDELRQQAKKICYGIIYGMGAKTLSQQLNTTENEALCFIETFKKSYPGVSNYLNSVIENCQSMGYVTTIMKRRRYLPSIYSEIKGERSQAERQAINTTIQGSAADIIKLAMIEVENQLNFVFQNCEEFKKSLRNTNEFCCKAFLVLQLHDELIYEVSENELDKIKDIIKTAMEGTTKLSVVLPVNIRVGSSWGSLKEAL